MNVEFEKLKEVCKYRGDRDRFCGHPQYEGKYEFCKTESSCPLRTEDIAQVKELESTIDKLKRAHLEMETYTMCGGRRKKAK